MSVNSFIFIILEVKVSVPVHIPPLTKEATFEHSKDMCLLCTWTRQRCFKTDDAGRGLRGRLPIFLAEKAYSVQVLEDLWQTILSET